MFYCNLEHISKKPVSPNKGNKRNSHSAKSRFHYISRTASFEKHKDNIVENLEFIQSGNMPNFAKNQPQEFWEAADIYERSNGRICSSLVIALPKELSCLQRIELAQQFIEEFVDRYHFPYSCAIHNHLGSLGGQEQPHLHLMYSERHVDDIERTPEQFFKRYNSKKPEKGGAQKLTADVLGFGKSQLNLYRQKTEELINACLEKYAPTKILEIRGLRVKVPSKVSCLSNEDYNNKYGTELKDVPIMNKALRFAREDDLDKFKQKQEMIAEINRLRTENNYERYKSYYHAEFDKQQQLKIDEQDNVVQEKTRGNSGPSFW